MLGADYSPGWNEYRRSYVDFTVALTDYRGRNLYNLEYVTRSNNGMAHRHWSSAKGCFSHEERAILWKAIMEALRELVRWAQVPRILRRVTPEMVGYKRFTEIADLLTEFGYAVTRQWQEGSFICFIYTRGDDGAR